jgi:hypothetical protein
MESDKIKIPLNKFVYLYSFLGGALFVFLGIFLIVRGIFVLIQLYNLDPEINIKEITNRISLLNPIFQIIVGLIGIVFFGYAALQIFRKLIDKNPGLIIDNTGITENTTGITPKHLRWENITGIKVFNMVIVKFIIIIIDNPNKYIEYSRKGLLYSIFRQMAKLNHKMTGSPVNIYANLLKCRQKKLIFILQEEFKKWKGEN